MVKEIQLTQGKVALVDDDDFERVSMHKWHAAKGRAAAHVLWYARTRDKNADRKIPLHRFILGLERGQLIDHKDGDGLNCQRENLRPATNEQNGANRSKQFSASRFKGVTAWRCRGDFKWRAQIQHLGKGTHLGLFDSEEDAARVYDAKAREFFGEFARTNFAEGA